MTQIDAATEQATKQLLTERTVGALLGASIVVLQLLWIGLLGYGLWSLF